MTDTSPITSGLFSTNLPFPPTPFIGREREIGAACAFINSENVRLLTLTGPGGTGKTRLSIQLAGMLAPDFKDGVAFVPLAAISDPERVATTIAQSLGVMETANRPLVSSLVSYLQNREMLLVLDNFEQVLDAASLVATLLGAAPGLKVIATSRQRLHLRGEQEFPVPPLSMPPSTSPLPPLGSFTQYEAVQLFVERAQALRADFTVSAENAAAVVAICRRLDGLPLAIELAAVRIKVLSPQSILDRLQRRLVLLTGGSRDLPTRQQTLRSTIEWSYDLLDDVEKRLFMQLSVFNGSRSLDAITEICGEPADGTDLLDVVASLVDKNLLQQMHGTGIISDTRFVMLETIQEYAGEKLQESGETRHLELRHADYFLALAEKSTGELRGSRQAEWLKLLDAEHDNVRVALRRMIEVPDAERALRLGTATEQFWKMRGHLTEGRAWLEEALSLGGPTQVRARAAMSAGTLAEAQGDYSRARLLLEECLDLFRHLGDRANTAVALRHLGNEARHEGDYRRAYDHLYEALIIVRESGDKSDLAVVLGDLGIVAQALGDTEGAQRFYEESLSLNRELRDRRGIAMMLVNLGEVARAAEDYDTAYALYEEGLAIARDLGDRRGVGMVLHNLGHVAYHRMEYERAFDLFSESLRIFYEMRARRDIAYCLSALGGLAGADGQPERAATLFSASQALSNTISSHLDPADLIEYERNVASTRLQMSPDDWNVAWTKGQAMLLGEAVAFALDSSPQGVAAYIAPSRTNSTRPLNPMVTAPLGDYSDTLSERELEVLRLVSTGLTDAQVAEQLVLSPRTVHRHLSSIYSKLGVTSRTAATRAAIERNLV